MPDKSIILSLSARPTETGFWMLAINSGVARGHDIEFTSEVLKESLPLWENVPCMVDHPGFLENPSVRDLAGSLHGPKWSDLHQGIEAHITPCGPSAAVLLQLREAARSDPAIMSAVGFSAVLRASVAGAKHGSPGRVDRIHQVSSVDCVINPARGGRFLSQAGFREASPERSEGDQPPLLTSAERSVDAQSIQSLERENVMSESTNQRSEISDLQFEAETHAFHAAQNAQKTAENKTRTAQEQLRQVRLQTCRNLLKVSLEASRLPAPSAERVENRFLKQLDKGEPFEPAALEQAIQEEQNLLSALTASGAIQGPARISGMVNTNEQLEAAVSDLFGVPREAKLQAVRPARLSGIRELYFMLTGDYDLHGGYYGERIQLATTDDFSGLVKNALNKVVTQQWDAVGKAGYDWWQKIVTTEHFNTLNTITGILLGTVGALPSVSEGAEYTELAIGDSPETADFTKYGGYIPLTLELIDRDDTRRLRAYAAELGNAAMRKISALVAAVFTANSAVGPTMADTGALFNSTAQTTAGGHKNLLTAALGTDYTAWNAVALAMFNQPMLIKNAAGYYGSGPKMAVWPKFCLVPGTLKAQADALFVPRWSSQLVAVGAAGTATWGGQVEVITVPEWTDDTDWAAVIDPAIAPAIIVGERFGLQPEIYTAGRETDPAVFMNDEHRIKVRMFNAVLVQDFRPLHKSNVAG